MFAMQQMGATQQEALLGLAHTGNQPDSAMLWLTEQRDASKHTLDLNLAMDASRAAHETEMASRKAAVQQEKMAGNPLVHLDYVSSRILESLARPFPNVLVNVR